MAQLATVLILIILLVGLFLSPKLARINTILFGLFLGTVYFIFMPLAFLLVKKSFSIPGFSILGSVNINELSKPLWILLGYILGLFLVFAILQVVPRKRNVKILPKSRIRKQSLIYKIAIILYFAISLILLFRSGVLAGGHWYRTKANFFEQSGEWAVVMAFIIWGLRLIIVSYTFELLELKVINIPKALLVVMLLSGYELLFVGNRIVILLFGVAGFIFIARRYGRLTLISTIILILPLAMMMALYQSVRHYLFTAPPFEILVSLYTLTKSSILGGQFWDPFLTIFEYADFTVLLKLLSFVGHTIEPLGGSTFLRMFSWFIPRSIWTSKPVSVDLAIGDLFVPGANVSIVGLLFSEIHYNFGTSGLLFFPLILMVVLLGLELMQKHICLNHYWGYLIGFLLIRIPVSNTILIGLFAFLAYRAMDIAIVAWKSVGKSQYKLVN